MDHDINEQRRIYFSLHRFWSSNEFFREKNDFWFNNIDFLPTLLQKQH